MASTRSSSNLHTVVSGLHLIFTIASVAFLSFKVYHLECELSLIRGKVSLSEGDIKVTEVTPLSADSNNEELRSERNRRDDQQKLKSYTGDNLKAACVHKLLGDRRVIDDAINGTGRLVCLRAPPRFTKKPPSFIVIKEGGNISFSFSTSGNPAPKITWSMQGKSRESRARFRILDDKFEMDNVRFEDEGLITCHAENMFGVEVSKVNLTVLGAPRFPKSPPVKLYGFLGTETKVECDLFGNPTPEVQWNKSPSSPLPLGRSEVKKDGLYINNTKKEDEGIYTCLATNEYGMVIHGTYLIVKAAEPPVFTVTPPEAVNISGVEEPVRINCSATGSPLPKITWYKYNITLPANIYINDDEVTSELMIGQPKPSLQNTYTCVARNLYNDEVKTTTKIVLRACGDPGKPDNAIIVSQSKNYWTGEYVRYLCNPGYAMVGPAVRRCLVGGKWSGNVPTCTEKPECEPYWTIDDNTRRKGFTASRSSKNDYYLAEGWYRFISGKQMSTSCTYRSGYCDTSFAGWLQGSHPSVKDGVVSRKVCFGYSGGYGGNCCLYSTYIKMRNCGSFYVYKLKPTPNSNCRYCTEY
ncbi:unnamed protein product [Porites lobata]|uniref:Uncharacterized protein n=1 Tax=Porites lobata TaxID=104759 RepID=A0ABN8QA32_9CNID|nr:unnamed protein product [Porites lobata]